MVASSIVLVDVGNTSIKFARMHDIDTTLSQVDSIKELAGLLQTQPKVDAIWFATVRKGDEVSQIQALAHSLQCHLHQVTTEKTNFGLANSYQNTEKMGVDRWLAMIAGLEMTDKPFAVIDAGTAITCDFVANGQHLGGWITPGFHLMRDALVKNTARVTKDDFIPQDLDAGNDTEACVSFGCAAAVNGVYLSAVDYLSSKHSDFVVIIGGGDQKLLALNHSGDILHAANLVMRGLARYAKAVLCFDSSD